jgi:hypothetical protein
MRSTTTAGHPSEPDPIDVVILRDLAAGRVPGKDLLDVELRNLAAHGFIEVNTASLPTLTPRGRLLLQVANGECAPPLD